MDFIHFCIKMYAQVRVFSKLKVMKQGLRIQTEAGGRKSQARQKSYVHSRLLYK